MNREQKCDCEENREHEASESCECDNEISISHQSSLFTQLKLLMN